MAKAAKKKKSAAKKEPAPEPGKPFLGRRAGILAVVAVLGLLLIALQQALQNAEGGVERVRQAVENARDRLDLPQRGPGSRPAGKP